MTLTPQHSERSVTQLSPVLSARFALGPKHVAATLFYCLLFMYLNYIPLFQTDIWGHVLYGKYILENGILPTEDPFMPLARGMEVVDTAWLGQVIIAAVESWGGAEYMSNMFALVVFSTWLLYSRVFYLYSRSIGITVAMWGLFFIAGYTRHAIIRPEMFGGLCFSLLLWMVVRCDPWRSRTEVFSQEDANPGYFPKWLWVVTPLLFLFWANAHGSFAVGLVFMACLAIGAIFEAAWRTRSLAGVLTDKWVRRWTILTELAVAATLINPYGFDLLVHTAVFGRNPNLRDVMEWFPMNLFTAEGIQFSISLAVMMILMRHSRKRMRAADVLLLAILAIATIPSIRMIGWFAPVYAFTMAPHFAYVVKRFWPKRRTAAETMETAENAASQPPRFTLTLVCLLLIWCAFAFSPVSQPLLSGHQRRKDQVHAKTTPLGITKYLRENPPEGIVFAPQWWSDWLVWDGPEGIQPFVMTNIHLVPHRVWQDYMYVAQGGSSWDRRLDKYNVRMFIVDKHLQEPLVRMVRGQPNWEIVYEDDMGVVLRRTS